MDILNADLGPLFTPGPLFTTGPPVLPQATSPVAGPDRGSTVASTLQVNFIAF